MRRERNEEERRQKAERRGNRFYRALAIIYTLVALAFIGALLWLDVLPTKYLYILIGVLVVISIFIVPVMYSKYGVKKRKSIAAVFAMLLIVGFGMGTYYLASTIDFLDDISIVPGRELKEDYYVVVSSQSGYEKLEDLTGLGVGTYMISDNHYSEAKTDLQKQVNVEYKYIGDLQGLFAGLQSGGWQTVNETTGATELQEYDAVFVSAANYESMKSVDQTLAETTKVIYTVSVKLGEAATVKSVNVTKEPFNVYISGIDVEGDINQTFRSDVNIVVTVNPKTHEVLMTSIPRDYYVNLPSKGAMDKLTHSGLYGAEETVSAVEEMMGIDINYYIKVNYSTVVKLVDAIGGIDIESPYTFTTHKMQDLSGITFYQGPNHLDGRMALAYSRERASWVDGDMRRNENQQLILEAIIKKAMQSTTILSSYTSILDAVRGNMETSLSEKEMTSLIKMQLNGMPSWQIEKTALKGKPDTLMCYALGIAASVVDQDHEQIIKTADQIFALMDDEPGSVLGDE